MGRLKYKAILIFLTLYSWNISKSVGQWNEVYFDSIYWPKNIVCLNEDTCFLLLTTPLDTNGKVLRTMNGGVSWDTIFFNAYNSFGAIDFLNDSVGVVLSRDSVFKTLDGGNSWSSYSGPCTQFNGFIGHMLHKDTFLFSSRCSTYYDIYLTTNGGLSFVPILLDTICSFSGGSSVSDFSFIDSLGFATGPSEVVYKTTDSGLSWNKIHEGCSGFVFDARGISFYNDSMGWMGGERPNYSCRLKYSTDGGFTWNEYTAINFQPVMDVEFFSDGAGYVESDDRIYKTTDYGITFNLQFQLSYSNPNLWTQFERLFFINSQVGYAVASHSVLKTTNGGGVGVQENNLAVLSKTFPNPNNGIFTISKFPMLTGLWNLIIYDNLGRIVFQKENIKENETELDLSYAQQGLYCGKIICGNKVQMQKVLIVK